MGKGDVRDVEKMGKWKPAENTNTDNQLKKIKKVIMHNFGVKFVLYIKTNKQMHNMTCLYCNPFF